MRKISAMYEWSGGADFRHTCGECKNCMKSSKGPRPVYKCLAYGYTNSGASDWKISFTACRHFNKPCPPLPAPKMERNKQEEVIEGQMNIFDFLEEMHERSTGK